MFKPHHGNCVCCGKPGIVVVKSGHIQQCNERIKKEKKSASPRVVKQITDPTMKKKIADQLKRKFMPKTFRKATGELSLFKEKYEEEKGRCEITGDEIYFSVWSFMHILGKGAYPAFRLYKKNIMHVKRRIHELYDNGSMEQLLREFPEAKIIYEKKDELKKEYYQTQKQKT